MARLTPAFKTAYIAWTLTQERTYHHSTCMISLLEESGHKHIKSNKALRAKVAERLKEFKLSGWIRMEFKSEVMALIKLIDSYKEISEEDI